MPLDPNEHNKLRVGNLTKVFLKRLHNDAGETLSDVTGITLTVRLKGAADPLAGAADLPFDDVDGSPGKYVAEIPSDVAFLAGKTYTLTIEGPDYRDEFDLKAVSS